MHHPDASNLVHTPKYQPACSDTCRMEKLTGDLSLMHQNNS